MDLLDYRISEKIWKISSECVQDDHYLLENLIASDETKRRTGFMAFHVSKPPVNIVLECKYKINLNCIKIFSTLNSLKCTKIQLIVEFTDGERIKTKTIADVFLEEEYSGLYLKTSQSTEIHPSTLKSVILEDYLKNYVRNFQKIIIIIRDTNFKRSPALKKIEIFGTFSNSNDQHEIEKVLKLLGPETPQSKNTLDNKSVECSSSQIDFKIPEEFLDAITLELLNLPYILPSGSIVDESTLEKHKQNESSHGRYPSDPFTGVLFTANSKPIFDAALKVRLDEFKLRNSDKIEIMNTGRCIGRKNSFCVPSTSKQFTSHVSKKIKLNKESSSLDEIIQSIYKNKQITSFIQPTNQSLDKKNACRKCNLNNHENLYKISTCDHVFCKKCTLSLNLICSVCLKKFENRNVIKINI